MDSFGRKYMEQLQLVLWKTRRFSVSLYIAVAVMAKRLWQNMSCSFEKCCRANICPSKLFTKSLFMRCSGFAPSCILYVLRCEWIGGYWIFMYTFDLLLNQSSKESRGEPPTNIVCYTALHAQVFNHVVKCASPKHERINLSI